jgi:hypothetical protein
VKITPGSCPYCGVINRESEAIQGLTAPPAAVFAGQMELL